MEQVHQIYYRGSLKFCNYSCTYCPFSKGRWSDRQLKQDREQLLRFIEAIGKSSFRGAVQIVPYGEALIHEYYWEGLARLSKCENIEAVGVQSNFSFSFENMYDAFVKAGGRKEKLRLWGTFHPEMVSVDAFLSACQKLQDAGILFCAGAVGVPEDLQKIQALREGLSPSVYLWINRMDGLGRPYTGEEIEAFTEVDEYFPLELKHVPCDASRCAGALFIKGDGAVFPCNLCRHELGNLYDGGLETLRQGSTQNVRKGVRRECSCYISYCNRSDVEELLFFQPYPAFRIPTYKKAVFFDVDGTLVPEGEREIPGDVARRVRFLARHSDIFLVTSLPYETAMKKTKQISDVVRGGVFANGARIQTGKEKMVLPLAEEVLGRIKRQGEKYGARVRTYRTGGVVYKVTLTFCDRDGLEKMLQEEDGEDCEMVVEQGRLQVMAAGSGKLEGIRAVCEKISVSLEEIAVFGNSENDIPMLKGVPFSVAVPGSSERVREAAGIKLWKENKKEEEHE